MAIREEMELVASAFGKKYLRDVEEAEFYEKLWELRNTCSDRALVRAAHFFEENGRAIAEAEALQKDELSCFLQLVQDSGDSSATLLQNQFSLTAPTKQEIPLAIMLSKKVLKQAGAVRVHGGGFAGTIQAFVPSEKLAEYTKVMDEVFGQGACQTLRIRPVGGVKVSSI